MAEVEYMHICDYAFPGENGKPCVIGIFDWIAGHQFPVTHNQLFIAIQFRGAPNESIRDVRIEIGRPNGDVLATIPGPPELRTSQDGGAFMNAGVNGLTFPEHGRYTIKAIAGGRALHTKSLQLKRIQMGGQTPPPVTH
jgi:hypothetical protein